MGKIFLFGGSGGIDVEGADAKPEQVLSGAKFFSNENEGDEIQTGSMPNNGTLNKSGLLAGASVAIPAGYTDGGIVEAASLASQTPGDVTAGKMLKDAIAWAKGNKVTGTIPIQSASTITITNAKKSYAAGYYPNAWDVNPPTQRSASSLTLGYSGYVDYAAGYYPGGWRVTAPAAGGVTRGAAGTCNRSTSSLASGTDTNIRITWNNIGFTPRYLCVMIGNISQSGAAGNNVSVIYYNGKNLSFYNAGGNSGYAGRISNISTTGCTVTFTIPGGWDAGSISGQSYFIAAA